MTYLTDLQACLSFDSARKYALESLESTLPDIGFDPVFVKDLTSLLSEIGRLPSTISFRYKIYEFRNKWRISLQRFYSWGYENKRIDFFKKYIFALLPEQPSCILDFGCGRGLFSEYLADWFPSANIIGIDESYFRYYWEDIALRRPRVKFAQVRSREIARWLEAQAPFDCTIMLWVLHHSKPSEADRLLKLLGSNGKAGDIFVCEDSFMKNAPPLADSFDFYHKWTEGAREEGFEPAAHAILDFVAVQVLAGYSNVAMPRNYRPGERWLETLRHATGREVFAEFIGFPNGRDIAVPQLLLRAPRHVEPAAVR